MRCVAARKSGVAKTIEKINEERDKGCSFPTTTSNFSCKDCSGVAHRGGYDCQIR